MTTVGYALVYWGIHHFPVVDGGKRVSLLDCLGVPQAWGLTKGVPVQLTTGGGLQGAGGSKAPSSTTKGCWSPATGFAGIGTVWHNSTTKKFAIGTNPPGPKCKTTTTKKPATKKPAAKVPTPLSTGDCWVLVNLPNYGGYAWRNRKTGKTVFQVSPPGPVCPPSGPVKPA